MQEHNRANNQTFEEGAKRSARMQFGNQSLQAARDRPKDWGQTNAKDRRQMTKEEGQPATGRSMLY